MKIPEWIQSIRAQVRRWPFWIWYVFLAFAAGLWLGCAPTPASAEERDPKPIVAVTAERTGAGTFRVKVFWHYQNDAGGAPDSAISSAAVDPTGSQFQSHRWPAAVLRDSFNLTSTPGVPMTGYGCVRTKRRGIEGQNACKPWSYTENDVPPLPPINDSVRVSALEVLPSTWTMAVNTGKQFCAMVAFATGQKALIGGQYGYPPCDSLETFLPAEQRPTVAQLMVAATYMSCSEISATAKECRKADGSLIIVTS